MNLFICYTPFHIRLAGEIIKEERLSNCLFVCLFTNKSEKNLYYFNKAEELASSGAHLLIKNNSILDVLPLLWTLIKLRFKLNGNFSVYTGNVKTFYSRIFLLLSSKYTLKTFDDGAGNISKAGYLYDDDSKSKKQLLRLIGLGHLTYDNLILQIKRHYTVYDAQNVYPNSFYLSFFSSSATYNTSVAQQKLNILLTSPLSEDKEMTLDEEKELYQNLIFNYNITSYIRHPRENNSLKIEENLAKPINSNEVAEDIILELMKDFEVNVYGLYSSVLLNLQQGDRLKLYNVHYESLYNTSGLEQLYTELNVPTLR